MDDNPNGAAEAVDGEDLNTTAPNPPDEWHMPEPVFRKTSGRLPQGFEKEIENAKAAHAAADQEQAAAIESPTPEPQPKSPTVKLIVVLLGLGAMIGFIAVFLTVVYFFFLR